MINQHPNHKVSAVATWLRIWLMNMKVTVCDYIDVSGFDMCSVLLSS